MIKNNDNKEKLAKLRKKIYSDIVYLEVVSFMAIALYLFNKSFSLILISLSIILLVYYANGFRIVKNISLKTGIFGIIGGIISILSFNIVVILFGVILLVHSIKFTILFKKINN